MEIKFKKLIESAQTPTYANTDDAALDLVATSEDILTMGFVTYGIGISVQIPKDHVGLILPRSSIRNYSLSLTNSVGCIDSGFTGEIKVSFRLTGMPAKKYKVGDRVAQLLIIPRPKITLVETEELEKTERGDKSFGSTGE